MTHLRSRETLKQYTHHANSGDDARKDQESWTTLAPGFVPQHHSRNPYEKSSLSLTPAARETKTRAEKSIQNRLSHGSGPFKMESADRKLVRPDAFMMSRKSSLAYLASGGRWTPAR